MQFHHIAKVVCLLLLNLCNAMQLTNNDPPPLCPYEQTVSLRTWDRYQTVSYHDIEIPPSDQQMYSYEIKFGNERVESEMHLRGCACKEKPCTKLCCEWGQYFNLKTKQCEYTQEVHLNASSDIWLNNAEYSEKDSFVSIFDYFTLQFDMPCQDKTKAISLQDSIWELYSDGVLLVSDTGAHLTTIDYCLTPQHVDDIDEMILMPVTCQVNPTQDTEEVFINTLAKTVTILFLIPIIFIYLCLKELRCNFRDKLLLCFLITLAFGYGIQSFIVISGLQFDLDSCSILGFTRYFFLICAFFWLTVLCIDVLYYYDETFYEFRAKMERFATYSLYAIGLAAILAVLAYKIQYETNLRDDLKPGLNMKFCWIDTSRWSALIYFYGPNLIILIFNLVILNLITIKIFKIERDVANLSIKEKFLLENAYVILRLFLIMAITWFFDIASYFLRDYKDWNFLFVSSDFCYAVQGVFIFVVFVFKRNVRNLLKEKCCCCCGNSSIKTADKGFYYVNINDNINNKDIFTLTH